MVVGQTCGSVCVNPEWSSAIPGEQREPNVAFHQSLDCKPLYFSTGSHFSVNKITKDE